MGISQIFLLAIVGSMFAFSSCKDDYHYDDEEPGWLGESIYDELESRDSFSVYLKMINDLGYTNVMQKTGSKTLLVASDAAFDRFFKDNEWGVSSYEDLKEGQKKLIFKYCMINNAYLIETLANFNDGELQKGTAMRRATGLEVTDTINFEDGSTFPESEWWDSHRSTGMYLVRDETNKPLVYFLQSALDNADITNNDFKFISGEEREDGDAYFFSDKVIERDITCKNGYVHVLKDVLIPPKNMAEYLESDDDVSIFSKLLERFSAPYYEKKLTTSYKEKYVDFQDSIFSKHYFSNYGAQSQYPETHENAEDLLDYDPGWNSYNVEGSGLQYDMAAMFVPTNEAMLKYLTEGSGKVLADRYGDWNGVPDEHVADFINHHLRASLLLSVPSKFDKMIDNGSHEMNVTEEDIVEPYVAVNGVVYKTNKAYPPYSYIAVTGPVSFGENTKVFDWAVEKNEFDLYLESEESQYSFFVPSDDYFEGYIEPVSYTRSVAELGKPGALKFWYDDDDKTVKATVYDYTGGTIGDSIGLIDNYKFLKNRLEDLLDAHIVVGGVETGDEEYFFTKGGSVIKVTNGGEGLNTKILGGGNLDRGETVNVLEVYNQMALGGNGYTYVIDKPIQAPLKSVYSVLSTTPQFSSFYNLCIGFQNNGVSAIFKNGKKVDCEVFVRKNNYYGVDYNVKFFNNYNYTVYVPKNDAVEQAISDGLIHSWDEINSASISGQDSIDAIYNLIRFIRYHFQDNSVYAGMTVDANYQTATAKTSDTTTILYTYKNKYFKLGVDASGGNITLTMDKAKYYSETTKDEIPYGNEIKATVQKDDGLYNIMARDYVFNKNPRSTTIGNIDDSENSTFTSTEIYSSSTAVIHQIDKVLTFE